MDHLSLAQVQARICEHIRNGTLDSRVLEALSMTDEFVPHECALWDYKREQKTDALALAELARDISSFYNTFGGYIVVGVDEADRDARFVPSGFDLPQVDQTQIRQVIRTYTGADISVTTRRLIHRLGATENEFILIHVPQRPDSAAPLVFEKNGPDVKPRVPLFVPGEIYLRPADQSVKVRGSDDLVFLNGNRDASLLFRTAVPESHGHLLEHNLPDRASICAEFVGRDDILQNLWRWFGDEFSRVRVLAGEGGKGKTSIAYQFAERVCRTRPSGLQKVVWLTAKARQFSAFANTYALLPEPQFHDLPSLLRQLSQQLAVLESEVEGASDQLLKRNVAAGLQQFPCLIVIDDVDSIPEIDEQRRIHEAAAQICSGTKSRALLTTRMNLSYSSDTCIQVGGMGIVDYRVFAERVAKSMNVSLSKQLLDQLRQVSDGSPLFTESIFRLCRSGMKLSDAIKQWRNKLGEEVRMAALLREIEHLSVEARRVLLACAYLKEASVSELKKVTSYDDGRMTSCIAELQSLFLLGAPSLIRREPRFRVSDNTAALIQEKKQGLVADPQALLKRVEVLRSESAGGTTHVVGAAIRQGLAILNEKRFDDAIATLQSALERKPSHPDLLLTLGRCQWAAWSQRGEPPLDRVRKTFRRAYDEGQRRDVLFEEWHQAECEARDFNGAREVCQLALTAHTAEAEWWQLRVAQAHYQLAQVHIRTLDLTEGLRELNTSVQQLMKMPKRAPGMLQDQLQQFLRSVNDERYRIVAGSRDFADVLVAFDTVKGILGSGDNRDANYVRLVEVVARFVQLLSHRDSLNRANVNQVEKMFREARSLLDQSHADSRVLLLERIRELRHALDTVRLEN